MHLSSLNQLRKCGRAPFDSICELAADKSIDVIAFGESHWWSNPQRELLKSLVEPLSRQGFTHICLEIEHTYQGQLSDFSKGIIEKDELKSCLQKAGASLFNPAKEACLNFFDIIEKARESGIEVVAMDKDRNQWHSRSFADQPRESFLAQSIQSCLAAGQNNRVLVLAGNNHLYVRDTSPDQAGSRRPETAQPDHLSMAEYLQNDGIKLVSLAGVLYSSSPPEGMSFSSLFPLTEHLENSLLIDTNGFDQVLGLDKRCPWGACSSAPSNDCPGIIYNICQKIRPTQIRLYYWDKLIFFDSSWWKEVDKHLAI